MRANDGDLESLKADLATLRTELAAVVKAIQGLGATAVATAKRQHGGAIAHLAGEAEELTADVAAAGRAQIGALEQRIHDSRWLRSGSPSRPGWCSAACDGGEPAALAAGAPAGGIAGDLPPWPQAGARAALILIPVLLLLGAACFAIAAAYLALAAALSPPAAAAIIALALGLLAVLEAVTVIALDRSAEERTARAARAARQSLLAPVEEAERQIAARPITSVLAAMAAGAVAAWLLRRRSSRRRPAVRCALSSDMQPQACRR